MRKRAIYSTLALCAVLIVVSYWQYQERRERASFCQDIAEREQQAIQAAYAEASMDWHYYKDDYIRMGKSREEAEREVIENFMAGAESTLTEMKRITGFDCH